MNSGTPERCAACNIKHGTQVSAPAGYAATEIAVAFDNTGIFPFQRTEYIDPVMKNSPPGSYYHANIGLKLHRYRAVFRRLP